MQAYMVDLVMDETEKVTEESLVFRENTIGTKSVEAFIRLVGMRYLHQTFGARYFFKSHFLRTK